MIQPSPLCYPSLGPRRASTTLLSLACLIGISSQAGAAKPSEGTQNRVRCEQSLTKMDSKSFLDLSGAFEPAATEMTVQATPVFDGEKISHFKLWRFGSQWESSYVDGKMAVQGDPRTFIIILGEEAAAWFGVKMVSAEEMQIPSIEYFNSQTEKLNNLLSEPLEEKILLRLYLSQSKDPVNDRTFLARIQSYQIPLAMIGALLVHDASSHLASLILPKIILDYIRLHSGAVMNALNGLRLELENESEAVQRIFYAAELKALSLMSGGIDAGTGNIIVVTEARIKDERLRPKTELYQNNALDVLQEINARHLIKIWSNLVIPALFEHLTPRTEDYGYIPSEETQMEMFRLKKLVENFESQFLLNLPAEVDKGLEYSHEELARFIDSRVEQIKTVIAKELQ